MNLRTKLEASAYGKLEIISRGIMAMDTEDLTIILSSLEAATLHLKRVAKLKEGLR